MKKMLSTSMSSLKIWIYSSIVLLSLVGLYNQLFFISLVEKNVLFQLFSEVFIILSLYTLAVILLTKLYCRNQIASEIRRSLDSELSLNGGRAHVPLDEDPEEDEIKELSYTLKSRYYDIELENSEHQKARHEAEKMNHRKSEFLANMSHELRTPMHSILSFSKICLKKVGVIDNQQMIKHLENIHNSGLRLTRLLDEILDISKLEAGRMSFALQMNNLDVTINESNRELQSLLLDNDINFSFKHPKNIRTKAVYDELRLQQVIKNLISNAIKFCPRGGEIGVGLYQEMIDGNEFFKIEVSDNGLGVPEDELNLIFDKFAQSSRTSTQSGGTGLGLCICRQIIEAHGGKIWAENNTTAGATFNILLPANNNVENKEILVEAS